MSFGARKPATDVEFARSFAKLTVIVSQSLKVELRIVMSSAGSTCRHSEWSAEVQRAKFWKVAPSIRMWFARLTCFVADWIAGCTLARHGRYVSGPQTPPTIETLEQDAQ